MSRNNRTYIRTWETGEDWLRMTSHWPKLASTRKYNLSVDRDLSRALRTTTSGFDTAEALFRRLLLFGDLTYLWPQVVSASASPAQAQRAVERFLQRYADDLAKLAAEEPNGKDAASSGGNVHPRMQSAASSFVQVSRLSVA